MAKTTLLISAAFVLGIATQAHATCWPPPFRSGAVAEQLYNQCEEQERTNEALDDQNRLLRQQQDQQRLDQQYEDLQRLFRK